MSGPRKVSQVELKRLKKRGKVRKKMGAQPEKEKPAPVATAGEGMSGSAPTEPPMPASPPQVEQPAVQEQPMASMAASMAVRDALLERMIDNNALAIAEFRQALTEQKPRVGVSYRHKVVRDKKSSLINEVISTPMEAQ